MPNLHDFSWPSQKCYLEWGNLLVELCNQVDQYEWRYTWFVRFGQKKESFVKSIQLDTPLSVQPNSCLKMRPRRKFGFPQVWKSWCGFPFQCLLLASYPGGEIFCFNLLTCCHWYFSSAWKIFMENSIVFHTKKFTWGNPNDSWSLFAATSQPGVVEPRRGVVGVGEGGVLHQVQLLVVRLLCHREWVLVGRLDRGIRGVD